MRSSKQTYHHRNRCKALGNRIECNSRVRLENYIKYLPAQKIERLAKRAEKMGIRVTWYTNSRDTARSIVWQLTKFGLIDLIEKEIGCCAH